MIQEQIISENVYGRIGHAILCLLYADSLSGNPDPFA